MPAYMPLGQAERHGPVVDRATGEARMTPEERSAVVLAFARVLYVNGQGTDRTVAAAQQLGHALGLRVKLIPRWGCLHLQSDDSDAKLVRQADAEPTGINMARVVSTGWAIEAIEAGRLAPDAAAQAIEAISQATPAPMWLFTLASGAGAVALSVIFGLEHAVAALLIFISAAAGAILRRGIAQVSDGVFVQPFCAALLAGIIGALAVRYELSSTLRLVALCPCMVLVPGPHILNGAIDLMNARVTLGAARLLYATLVIVAISAGLLLGLALFGVSLPVDQAGRVVPLWQDLIAAGVAVASYSVFFSTPLNFLPWPVAVGMLAHALRWEALAGLGANAATGAFVACFAVGVIITPVARRSYMPFAAIGFASVVSMIPGVYLFKMASGLVQVAAGSPMPVELISATVADGVMALTITLGMSFGLIVPKLVIDRLSEILSARIRA
jgi:uncharacterized membrane protein YjjP (DUF1212 family)